MGEKERKEERDRQKDTEGGAPLPAQECVCTFSLVKPVFHSSVLIGIVKITELEELNKEGKLRSRFLLLYQAFTHYKINKRCQLKAIMLCETSWSASNMVTATAAPMVHS